MIKIDGELLEFISHAAKSTHPNEFAAFLREEKGIILTTTNNRTGGTGNSKHTAIWTTQ